MWKSKEIIPESIGSALSDFPFIIRQLLYNRGVESYEDAINIFQPEYANSFDPFIFGQMDRSVERIWKAINSKEKIVVFADYDADAVTACATLLRTFEYLGMSADFYIPDRFSEGYGLNNDAFENFVASGHTLVITVDCGTNSVDVAEFCLANGIDLIITDHHEITGDTPEAYALVNPKNPVENYPDTQITGVGVAFKLVQAILKDEERVMRHMQGIERKYVAGYEKWLLDLVAIGTVADCHSLFGENRIFVTFGLQVLAKTKWQGLKQLLEYKNIEPPFDSRTLGFSLAPMINAAGRLVHASLALKLLIENNPIQARETAVQLAQVNVDRQELTLRMVSEAKDMALLHKERSVLVLSSEHWHKGVVGLVAGRLLQETQKPVVVLSEHDGEATGSVRAPVWFDAVEALKYADSELIKYGGHKGAAGLTLRIDKIEKLYIKLAKFTDQIPEESRLPVQYYEAELQDHDFTIDTAEYIARLAPFGVGNPDPLFMVRNVTVLSTRLVGEGGKHIQLEFQKNQKTLSAIAFSSGHLAARLTAGTICSVIGELKVDHWNQRKRLKFFVKDFLFSEDESNG